MSGLKAIRRRIVSVRNTKQITRAMKLVSAAKLRRAQDAAVGGRSYTERLIDVLRVAQANIEAQSKEAKENPLFQARPVKTRLVMFVAGERGLCGAYNGNLIKAVQANEIQPSDGASVILFPMGKQAESAARRFGWEVYPESRTLVEDINQWPLAEISAQLTKDFLDGVFDELVIYYTKFNSVLSQVVTREVMLPYAADAESAEQTASKAATERNPLLTSFDPSPEQIVTELLPMLLASRVRQAGLEARASEYASRMTAMDSATKNADELITQLRLFYNRARQSTITRELIDIVGGAEAIK